MKEGEVASLVRHLLQADKVIHEQQLGWSWSPPDDALFTPSGTQVS
jgi:dynein regulatory complex protein 1